jgi:16S rRNA (uracil1498-N3)-methyltransferase
MKIHRFFVEEEPVGDRYLLQDEALVHQIVRVLRLGRGEHIALVTHGAQHVALIEEIEKKYIAVRIIRTEKVWVPRVPVTLYLATIRKERFEWALEKCTELVEQSVGWYQPFGHKK